MSSTSTPKILPIVLTAVGVISSTMRAQQMAGPSLGAVFDSRSGEIRQIWGIPGSASIGEAVALGFKLSTASICPDRSLAAGVAQENGKVVLISFGRTTTTSTLLDLPVEPDQVIFSPSCSAAAVVYRSSSQAWIIAGLPDHPSLTSVELPASSVPGSAAIDDAGTALLVATSENDGTISVERLSPASPPACIYSAAAVSSIVFLPHSSDALIADRRGKQLFRIQHAASGQALPSIVRTQLDGIGDAISLTTDARQRYALLANASRHSVTLVSLIDGSDTEIQCLCEVTGIARLTEQAVFRLGDRVDRPLPLLDVTGDIPRIRMLPTARPSSSN